MQSALAHGLEPPGERGKHNTLDADLEQQILDWIEQKAEQSTPVGKREIKDYCTTELKVPTTRGWVNSFVIRHSDRIFKTKSAPQEQQRLQVPRVFLERTVQDLSEHVQGCVAELVFNLDEVGISDWEDRKAKTKTVIVPATMRGQTIHHEISRTVKHISVIACVSAAGESLTPYIVTSQRSTAVQEQLKKQGVRLGTDFVLRSNPKPYINAEIFLDYIRTVFLPNLAELRTLDAFSEETAVLLMDNCPSHVTDEIIGLLTEARVRVITFAPHTTQIFQILDLTLFGVLKRRTNYQLPFEDERATVKFIMKVYHDFKQTMVEPNIWGAFRAIGFGFGFDTESEPYRLLFDGEKLRQSAGFRELWSIDFPLDQLSSRRQNARFGWININKPE